jgi:putative redox protein
VEDLVDAAGYVGSNYEAPKLLIGHSLGGAAVLRAAREIPSIAAVVTIGAPYNPGHVGDKLIRAREEAARAGEANVKIGGKQFSLEKGFFEDLEAASRDDAVAGLDRPILVLHSPADTIVGIDNAADIFSAARHPKSFVSLGEADHLMLNAPDAKYAGGVIAAWAARYI